MFANILEYKFRPKIEIENNYRLIHKITEILFFIIVRVTPICLLLKCFVNIAVFVTTDSGNDSLVLPIPVW